MQNLFLRNLGLLNKDQQADLERSTVLITGCGGMGGIAAEALVRMGIGSIKLADFDIFEESNSNRQVHCNKDTIGQNKARALESAFKKINPNLKISVFEEGVTKENIKKMIKGVDVCINGMDQMHSSLILERNCRKNKITIVDAWLTPFASVFVMTPDSPHWEEYLDLPTKGIPLDQLTQEICDKATEKEVQYTFSHFDPMKYVSDQLVKDVMNKKTHRPSLVPVCWLSGILMANEAMKFLTGQECTDFAGIFYDQYSHQVMSGNAVSKMKKVV